MPWESRSGRRYYYLNRRDERGRSVKEYLGTGPRAQAAARRDADTRATQEADSRAEVQLRRDLVPLDSQTDELVRVTDTLTRSVLQACGFHQPAGIWRKRRHGRQEESTG
jgi:hypothetical protein